IDAFQRGLGDLGHIVEQNIAVEYRFAEGQPDRLRALADELVHLKVSVIVTEGTTSTRYAKEATSTIPIVMAQDPDPVGMGFVASLARPGGNITGLSNLRTDLGGKRLEILKDTVPGLARVAIIGTSTTPGYAQSLVDVERAAGILTLRLQVLEILGPQDIETAFQAATDGRARGPRAGEPAPPIQSSKSSRRSRKNPDPDDLLRSVLCEGWGPYELRREHNRPVPPRRELRRQDCQGS